MNFKNCRTIWRQIWRVAGRESGYPELLGSPRTSPEVPRTSPEVFRRLPRKFSHCGTLQQSRGSPEVSQTSPEVPRTSPEVSSTSRRSALSLGSLTPSPDSQKLSLNSDAAPASGARAFLGGMHRKKHTRSSTHSFVWFHLVFFLGFAGFSCCSSLFSASSLAPHADEIGHKRSRLDFVFNTFVGTAAFHAQDW